MDYYLSQPSMNEPNFELRGAKILGIEGQFSPEMAQRLFEARNPETDERLPGIRMVKNRRGAFDITFNRDKASSLIELVGGDERLEDVQLRAELKAMKLVEKQARVRVRKQSEIDQDEAGREQGFKFPVRHTGNIVGLRFKHPDNREGEPHSHSHWIVFNVSHDKKESGWKAVELGFIDRKEINKVYHKEYARGLRTLGYKAKWDGKEMNLAVPKELQAEFSQRGRKIRELKADYASRGGLSPEGMQKVQLFNRPEKNPRTLDDYQRTWLSQLTELHGKAIHGLIEKARSSVSRSRWREGALKYVDRVRQSVISHREVSRERQGIER